MNEIKGKKIVVTGKLVKYTRDEITKIIEGLIKKIVALDISEAMLNKLVSKP